MNKSYIERCKELIKDLSLEGSKADGGYWVFDKASGDYLNKNEYEVAMPFSTRADALEFARQHVEYIASN